MATSAAAGRRWSPISFVDELKAKARAAGLWNFFLPSCAEVGQGSGLSSLDYAPLAELMGCNEWCAEVFNCNAPDTGNMEVIAHFGTDEQKERWLTPLLNGDIRSCFAMTEPQSACSDAATSHRPKRRRCGRSASAAMRRAVALAAASRPHTALMALS